ncbi:prolow-density lipoprotein receptor-related protein 1-like isoform X2 [Haliotis rufescens]|uniref:prolow-density lipoprotein receptor-related protein 1-like isoform X2 n=1 Tax=Haliotis rufescens TaxID=6454 RepID=UPI00201EB0E8|nr:prolow-density lipoprotein receptor-related protein 1-like isoform X2 [Haliotis rufescens]
MRISTICLLVFTGFVARTKTQDHPEVTILLTERHTLFTLGSVYRWDLFKDRMTRHNITSVTTPTAIDYDNVTRRIYWTDISREEIRSSELDGGNNTLVRKLNSVSNPHGMTVDGSAGKIFYTDLGNKVIVRIDISGSNSTVIVSENVSYPIGIIADKTDRKLYWLDHDTDIIESCNYDGSGRTTLVSTGVDAPTGATFNEKTGRLYWCEYNGNVYSILKDGTDRRTHYRNILTKPRLMDIAVFNGFLYIIDRTYRGIRVIPEKLNFTHMGILSSRYFKTLTGIHVFSPNSEETGCADGRYGAGCTSECGLCTGGMSLCEKTTGSCLAGCEPGYKGNFCKEECRPGTYGKRCSPCGKCKQGTTCHHVTGKCPSGCQPGWRGGDTCQQRDCHPGLYGLHCSVPCGHCKSEQTCDSNSGSCPSGCSAGWRGATCKQRCIADYYGEGCRRMCGYCHGDVCNPTTGVCPNGCQPYWKGDVCQDLNVVNLTSSATKSRERFVDALIIAAASRIFKMLM